MPIYPTAPAAAAAAELAAHEADVANPHSVTAAQAGAIAGSAWDDDLPQDPGNTVYLERYVATAGLKVGTVAVLAPILGASAAGTYVFDVLKNGTSVMTGTINLETVVAGTWSTGTLKSDGTEDLSVGDKLRAHAVSDNGDLSGYTDGIMFTVGLAPQ